MDDLFLEPITDTDFEEFCYDLLGTMGFRNRTWRKGTPLSTSPADRGRDIQCQLLVHDVDWATHLETWFVECKHHSRGVSPEKLMSALSWAAAERPAKLLIICSGFLSNPSKDHLDRYRSENRPPFIIKVWERPNLADLCVGKLSLVRKYKIRSDASCVSILNSSHLLYLKAIPFNSLDYFFAVLESVDVEPRERALDWVYHFVFPRLVEREKNTYGDIFLTNYLDTFSYSDLRTHCNNLRSRLSEPFIVNSIVQWTLQGLFAISDTTSTRARVQDAQTRKEMLENLESLPPEKRDKYSKIFDESVQRTGNLFTDRQDAIEHHIRVESDFIRDIEERTKKNYELYQWFCDNVVARLLEERLLR